MFLRFARSQDGISLFLGSRDRGAVSWPCDRVGKSSKPPAIRVVRNLVEPEAIAESDSLLLICFCFVVVVVVISISELGTSS